MNKPTTITIDEVQYVRADSVTHAPSEIQIVVIEGRWNVVGHVTDTDTGVTIRNAHVIRYWGTTDGLGQIALGGPTNKTKLDRAGQVQVPRHAILMRIDCVTNKWGGHL